MTDLLEELDKVLEQQVQLLHKEMQQSHTELLEDLERAEQALRATLTDAK